MRPSYHEPSLRLVLILATLALGACSGDTNLVRDAAIASGLAGSEPKPPPDFISRSRATSIDYIPVGTDAPRRTLRPKGAAEVSAAEAELNATRAHNEARGARARQERAP